MRIDPLVRVCSTAVAVASLAATPGAAASSGTEHGCRPRIEDLGTLPGGASSEVFATDDHGRWYGVSAARTGRLRAVVFTRGRVVDLHVPGNAWAADVHRRRTVLANGLGDADLDTTRAFVVSHGRVRALALPAHAAAGWTTYGRRLNAHGDVTGSITDPAGVERATVWRRGRPRYLPTPAGFDGSYGMAIDDRGDVVGAVYTSDQLVAWGWDRRGHGHVLAAIDRGGYSQANVLDDSGRAAGLSDLGGGPGAQAALWQHGSERGLGLFAGADFSFALGTNHRGTYVGQANYTAGGDSHVMVTRASATARLLTLLPLSGDQSDDSNAHAVSRDDTVGGFSDTTTGAEHATLWTCAFRQGLVPQPEAGSARRPRSRPPLTARGDPRTDLLARG